MYNYLDNFNIINLEFYLKYYINLKNLFNQLIN